MTPYRIRVYEESAFVGFLTLDDDSATLIARAYTRRNLATTSLYELRNHQFILYDWDHEDPSKSKSGQRLRPCEAAEWLERHNFDVPADLEKHLGPDLAPGTTVTTLPAAADWLIHVRTADEGQQDQKYADAMAIVFGPEREIAAGVAMLNLKFKDDLFKPTFFHESWATINGEARAWARLSLVEVVEKSRKWEPWSAWQDACRALWMSDASTAIAQPPKLFTNVPIKPRVSAAQSDAPAEASALTGFHGISSLMKAFGQPENRRDTIKKRLERLRTSCPDGAGLWSEQANPSTRTPRFLYNAADTRVRNATSRI